MPDILSPKPINCELRGMAKSFESFESMEIVTRVQERTIWRMETKHKKKRTRKKVIRYNYE